MTYSKDYRAAISHFEDRARNLAYQMLTANGSEEIRKIAAEQARTHEVLENIHRLEERNR